MTDAAANGQASPLISSPSIAPLLTLTPFQWGSKEDIRPHPNPDPVCVSFAPSLTDLAASSWSIKSKFLTLTLTLIGPVTYSAYYLLNPTSLHILPPPHIASSFTLNHSRCAPTPRITISVLLHPLCRTPLPPVPSQSRPHQTSTVRLIDCKVKGNGDQNTQHAGGIVQSCKGSCLMEIINTTIQGNRASLLAGGRPRLGRD